MGRLRRRPIDLLPTSARSYRDHVKHAHETMKRAARETEPDSALGGVFIVPAAPQAYDRR